jgi:hypothetical protein
MSEVDAARYIGMSGGWLKKSRTRRFRCVTDAPPFVRAGSRRIVCRRRDLDVWLAARLERVGPATRTAVGEQALRPAPLMHPQHQAARRSGQGDSV